MTTTDELEKRLAKRDIDNADREIARLNEQIRALEKRIREQESTRLAALKVLGDESRLVATPSRRAARIYLVRQHVQVGDEMILAAFLNRNHALDLARRRRQETGTKNFDVVGVNDGELREDI